MSALEPSRGRAATRAGAPPPVRAAAGCLAAYGVAYLALGLAGAIGDGWANPARLLRGLLFMAGPAVAAAALLTRRRAWAFAVVLTVLLLVVNGLIALYQVAVFAAAFERGTRIPGALGPGGLAVELVEVALLAVALVLLVLPRSRSAFRRSGEGRRPPGLA